MPIYEYTCTDCNSQFENFVRSMNSVIEVKCPKCGGTHVKKGWSVFGTGGSAGGSFDLSASAASSCNVGGT
jgi:putative FmdB family regulatory protein